MTDTERKTSLWSGEGWSRTQRQLGVLGLFGFGIADSALTSFNVPVIVYTIIGGLLGLDVLLEALDKIRGNGRSGP